MTPVDEVKRRVDIVEVIGAYTKLQRAGKLFKGMSPFKAERTASFFIYPDSQIFVDFSSGEKGDVFSFLMKKEGWTFAETLRELARRTGVVLEERTPEQKQSEDHLGRLREASAAAADYFHTLLLSAPQAGPCREYVRQKRQLTDTTIATWKLGYSLPDGQALNTHLAAKGFKPQELIDAGLMIENDEGRRYDRFRGRLMIPINDDRGRTIGFGSRSLDGSEPKYMNSPQTGLFDKGRTLFGLDRARAAIRNDGVAVLVEGYMDVIGPQQAGFSNVVSGMGTALTEDQFRVLKRLTDKIVFALDPDAAGNRAVMRGVDVARETLDREERIVFDPRGTIKHETRLKADIRVAVMPDGKDPDEIALSDPAQWRDLIANARPVIAHVIDTILAEYDIADPTGKSKAVQAVAPIIKDLTDPTQADHYTQLIARRLQLTPRAVGQAIGLAQAEAARKAQTQQRPPPRPAMDGMPPDPTLDMDAPEGALERPAATASRRKTVDLEAHLLAILAAEPALLMDANVALSRANLEPLGAEDFLSPMLRTGFIQLDRAAKGQPLPESSEADEWLSIIAEVPPLEIDPKEDVETRQREEIIRMALRLREDNLRREQTALKYLIDEAQEAGDALVLARHSTRLADLTLRHFRAQKALRLRSAISGA
ncbi:MAG TPA: DNA primase [Thermoflexales bacterium]|jgi:DNA primase|nr:DNA primase [Anaerolineae bacterium]HQV28303.1 DNA primase [Thermoflexales bacterium]HQX10761.1 DNA primase [Thermoflexales bacterium]HQY23802.1 DNA primase [Thermoflexales bacterium]HQZ53103.1 DNA primase [Thermoflexales bacterium]